MQGLLAVVISAIPLRTTTFSTELSTPAQVAAELARKPEVMAFVLRLWWFGVIPGWTHHITVVRLAPLEIHTHEHGGAVRLFVRLMFPYRHRRRHALARMLR